MKAFENWYNKKARDFHHVTRKELAEIAWQEALNWIKEAITAPDVIGRGIDLINDELEER